MRAYFGDLISRLEIMPLFSPITMLHVAMSPSEQMNWGLKVKNNNRHYQVTSVSSAVDRNEPFIHLLKICHFGRSAFELLLCNTLSGNISPLNYRIAFLSEGHFNVCGNCS